MWKIDISIRLKHQTGLKLSRTYIIVEISTGLRKILEYQNLS
jgi:hypothetical protein